MLDFTYIIKSVLCCPNVQGVIRCAERALINKSVERVIRETCQALQMGSIKQHWVSAKLTSLSLFLLIIKNIGPFVKVLTSAQ